MGTNFEQQIILMQRASRERVSYFLSAVSAACIGFAITQTNGEALASHHVGPGLAVLLWACSFIAGIGSVKLDLFGTDSVLEAHQLPKGDKSDSAGLMGQAAKYRRDQLLMFSAATVIYMVWHVWRMWSISM